MNRLSLTAEIRPEEKRLSLCETVIFALCTLLFTMLAFRGLDIKISPALPAVCFLLSGAVKAVSEKFSKWLALIPAVISAGIAMIFTRFAAELYFLTDKAGNILAENNRTLFFPTDEKTAEPLISVILLSTVLSSSGALVPQRLYLLFLAVCGAVFSGCFDCLSIYAVLLCALAAVCLLTDLKSSPKATTVFAVLTAATVSAGYFAGLHNFSENSKYKIPECEIEVVLEKPQPMYLRERTEQSGNPAEYSDSFYWLYEEDFFPLTQTKNLYAAVGETQLRKVTVNVKSGSLSHPLVPYGTADCENVSADKNSLGGVYPSGNSNFYSYEISEDYISDGLKNLSALGKNAEKSEEYLKLEQLYREYVYGEFTAISEKDSETASAMGLTVKPSADEKLKAVKDYFAQNITADHNVTENPQSLSQLGEVSRKGNALDYAYSAVKLLRYEGLPARLCGGYVIDRETAETTPSNGVITLTAENYHYWAEYYLDGVGWLPLEVFPDYADMIKTSAYDGGETAENSGTDALNSPQSQQSAETQQAPENASEITDTEADEKPSYAVISVISILIVILLFILVQRVKALIKRRKRSCSDPLCRARENHTQALKLLAVTGRDVILPPEKLAVSLGENKASKDAYEKSESVMSKAFYSDKKITADEAKKCAEFYKSARKTFSAECGSFRKIYLILFRGLY